MSPRPSIALADLPPGFADRLGPDSPLRQSAPRRRPEAREHAEQVQLFRWADDPATRQSYPELAMLAAVPNGGHRHKAVAAKLKAEGVRSAYPDIVLDVARGGYFGLRLEMKAPGTADKKPGMPSPEQRDYLGRLERQGYASYVVWGFEQARRLIVGYLDLPPTPFKPMVVPFPFPAPHPKGR